MPSVMIQDAFSPVLSFLRLTSALFAIVIAYIAPVQANESF